jgi:protein-disulfide isomerase
MLPGYWKILPDGISTDIPRGITEDGHPWIGAESPELTITEFSDYLCFQCKKMHYYLRRIVAQYPTKIRLVHRHFPMDHEVNFIVKEPFHIGSGKMALAAIYSVSKDKFWEMNDLLFELAGSEKEMNLTKLASKTSLDSKGMARAIYSQKMRRKLKIDIWTALKFRMVGTPSYLIDGKVYHGQLPPEIFKKFLN